MMRIVVIGAGILGASTAYHLARDGADVVVVDASLPGRATAAGAGIVCPWAADVDDAVFYALYAAGGRYYAELVADMAARGECDTGYRRSGAMLVSDDAAALSALERRLRKRQADAPEMGPISALTQREVGQLFPPLRTDLAGVHLAGGARVDGRRITAALLRSAERMGATVRHGRAVLAVAAGRVTGIVLESERVSADRVVVAAGAWAPSLLQPHGIALPVAPQRGQIMHFRLSGHDTRDWPVVLPAGSHYLLAFDDGRIVAGATRETGSGFDFRVTAGGQAEVLAEALQTAPGLRAATVIETRVGFRPVGPGIRPLLGAARGVERLVIGNGLGSAGLTLGPFAGRLLAEVALGRKPAIDLVPFDPLLRHTASPGTMPELR
jgi:D-amino-acid dehydrogenase